MSHQSGTVLPSTSRAPLVSITKRESLSRQPAEPARPVASSFSSPWSSIYRPEPAASEPYASPVPNALPSSNTLNAFDRPHLSSVSLVGSRFQGAHDARRPSTLDFYNHRSTSQEVIRPPRAVSPSVFDTPQSIKPTNSARSPSFSSPYPPQPLSSSQGYNSSGEPIPMRPVSFETGRSLHTPDSHADSALVHSPSTKASKDPLLDKARKRFSEGAASTASTASRLAADLGQRVRLSIISNNSRASKASRASRTDNGLERLSSERGEEKPTPARLEGQGVWTGRGDYLHDPNTNKRIRKYKLHPGDNRFYLGGRILTSSDSPLPFVVSLCTAFFLPVLFLAFNGRWLANDFNGGAGVIAVFAYLTLVLWVNMLRTAWSDPGIIPRNLHDPDTELIACPPGSPEDLGGGMAARPKHRLIRVRDGLVTSKWCETCKTYRPPRTSHCRLCNNCVERTDHHCSWLNNCVGSKNYASFFVFLVSCLILLALIVGFSVTHLVEQHAATHTLAKWDMIGSIIVTVITFGLGAPVMGLLGYHARLIWLGKTTIELLRPRSDRDETAQLFAMRAPYLNFVFTLCRPFTAPTYAGLHKHARQDERLENPAYV